MGERKGRGQASLHKAPSQIHKGNGRLCHRHCVPKKGTKGKAEPDRGDFTGILKGKRKWVIVLLNTTGIAQYKCVKCGRRLKRFTKVRQDVSRKLSYTRLELRHIKC